MCCWVSIQGLHGVLKGFVRWGRADVLELFFFFWGGGFVKGSGFTSRLEGLGW